MRKIVGIGGEPATGKTTLMRAVIDSLDGLNAFQPWVFKKLRGEINHSQRVLILGLYSGRETFAGTDRLSMAVMPDAIEFLRTATGSAAWDGWAVLFEGDRLFSSAFIAECFRAAPTSLFLLMTDDDERDRRHRLRGDTQSESWLKGRATKVAKIFNSYKVTPLNSETAENLDENLLAVLRALV